jgi:hypothetical protein
MEVPMATGRPKADIGVELGAGAQLESMASSRSLPAGLVTRVRIVLLSAAGKMNQQIAGPLSGRQRRIRSSLKSSDCVNVFPGRTLVDLELLPYASAL